jgi:hypothetical protein
MHTKFYSESPKGRELGRARFKWEDNIKMDLKEIDCRSTTWVHLRGNS